MPTGFLPIDPKLPTGQRRDDMGRKAGMTWLLRSERQGTPKTDWVGRGGGAAGRGSARKGWLNA